VKNSGEGKKRSNNPAFTPSLLGQRGRELRTINKFGGIRYFDTNVLFFSRVIEKLLP